MMRLQEIIAFVQTSLECSVYIAPTDPGLTHDELLEVGRRLAFQPGEIGDAVQHAAAPLYWGAARLQPKSDSHWGQFHHREDPDYRNVGAFDFVCRELRDLTRSQGQARACIDRTVMVERAVQANLPRHDVEVAVAILLNSGHLAEKDGVLRFAGTRHQYPLPSEQLQQHMALPGGSRAQPKPLRGRVYSIVRDVIDRRTDGRPAAAESLDAFAEELGKLGYGPFRLWWIQVHGELRRLDPSTMPVSVAVLSAALVEGAPTFVVKHARSLNLGVFGSTDFAGEPRKWKIDDLVVSAAKGQDAAILDAKSKQRADELIKVRQRIHAGRMLADFPAGVPDLRPEEAREAKDTATMVVRRVLDWLQKYPPSGGPRLT